MERVELCRRARRVRAPVAVLAVVVGMVLALTGFHLAEKPLVDKQFGAEFPYGYSATGVTVGGDGAVWFTEQDVTRAAGVYRIDPATGALTRFDVDAHVLGITIGRDGALWMAEVTRGIGRLDPVTGKVTQYSANFRACPSPWGIATGPDGALWFSVFPCGQGVQPEIGRLDPVTGKVTYYGYHGAGIVSAIDVTAGPDRALWFSQTGDHAIGRLDPRTGRISSYAVGITYDGGYSPGGLTAGPDGAMWFTGGGRIGRLDPATGKVTHPADGKLRYSEPRGITVGPGGALWFTEIDPTHRKGIYVSYAPTAGIGSIDPASGKVTQYHISITCRTGLGAIATGRDGALWFTQGSRIGRIHPSELVGHAADAPPSAPRCPRVDWLLSGVGAPWQPPKIDPEN